MTRTEFAAALRDTAREVFPRPRIMLAGNVVLFAARLALGPLTAPAVTPTLTQVVSVAPATATAAALSDVAPGPAEAPELAPAPRVVLAPPVQAVRLDDGTGHVVTTGEAEAAVALAPPPPADPAPVCWPTVKAYLDAWTVAGAQPAESCIVAPDPAPAGAPGTVPFDEETYD